MSFSISLNKFSVFIGQIGEAIVKKYLETNGFKIYAEEYEIPFIGARVDFLISKDDNKEIIFDKIKYNPYSWIKRNSELIIAQFKGKKYVNMSWSDISKLQDEVSEKHSTNFITHFTDDEEETLVFYDLTSLALENYNLIKDNFMIVEVKASVGRYPRKKGASNFTRSQMDNVYYDSLLRVKINSDISKGFEGMIHPEDLEQLETLFFARALD